MPESVIPPEPSLPAPPAALPQEQVDMPRQFAAEVRDAVYLLDFAVAQGRPLPDELIERIKRAQNYIKGQQTWPPDEERSTFEKAYRDLAQLMKPVSAASLRDTADRKWRGYPVASRAVVFSRQLYGFVLLAALVILLDRIVPYDEEKSNISTFTRPLLPFAFGLLGACMYLLRTAHSYIIDRTFDINRRPEYYNRMLLGFLSGSVILLFVNPDSIGAGQSAVSFIVGYNTDYLFQTIERLGQAFFPKESKATAAIASISADKKTLNAGDSGKATVALTAPAGPDGATATLTADAGITLDLTSVKIAKGTTTGTFTFKVDATAPHNVKLTITGKVDGTSASETISVI
jgi:hypothetical protein